MKSTYNFVFLLLSLNVFAAPSKELLHFEEFPFLVEQVLDEDKNSSACDTVLGGFVIPNDSIELVLFDQYVCFGDSIQVDFPEGDFSRYESFSWFQKDEVLSSDSSIIIHKEDTFRFELYGCDTLSQAFELIYYTSNQGDSLLPDLNICEGDTVEVQYPRGLTGGYTAYRWFFEDEFYSSSLGAIEISESGTYSLELYGCDTIKDSFVLTTTEVNRTSYSFPDTIICPAEDNYIHFPEGDFSSYKEFSWLYNGEFYSTDSTILIDKEGVYGLSFTGCYDRIQTFQVSFPYTPIPEFYFQPLCLGDSIVIDFSSKTHQLYPNISWFRDSVLFSEDSTLTTNEIGSYQIEFYGCDTLIRNFEISYSEFDGCDCQIAMPNFFSPNGDNKYDEFKPFYIHNDAENQELCTSTDYNLQIFNQWGKNIYSSNTNDELPNWDGKNSRGNNRLEGLYYYRITYKLNTYPPDVKHDISGYFHIYR